MHKLIGPDRVGVVAVARWRFLGFAHGPEVCAPGPFFSRTNSVAPVVAIRKTAARKANYCGFDLAHVFDQAFAKAIDIRYRTFFADPNAVVQHAAEIFHKMTINVGRNGSQRLIEKHFYARVGRA